MPGLPAFGSETRLVDGSVSFRDGVDSGKLPTVASPDFPEGLKRTQLSWLQNASCRGGGLTCRTGWKKLATVGDGTKLFQGGAMYTPDYENPYLILSIGGSIIQVRVDTDNSVYDLSATFGLTNPPLVEQAHFCQGETFLIIQAGDGSTLPLFWYGTTPLLRRSNGITGITVPGPGVNEIPAGTAMDYYMGRLWYANSRVYAAGDIVRGPSGTAPYQQTDSILKVTENLLALGGDGFVVPSNAGNIRGLEHTAELDTALGEGSLYVGTTRAIYRLNVPVTRMQWIAADGDNQPRQTVVQRNFGYVNDRSVVAMNGDLFYQTLEPAVRSLQLSIRYFTQWGNTPISNNEERVLNLNDRALLKFSSGMEFNNRLWQTVLPYQTPVGCAHAGVMPLDFDLISSLEEKLPPVWEGMYQGMPILQMWSGDFGGRQRAFAAVWSEMNGAIEVWEMTLFDKFENQVNNDGNRIEWFFETPAYTWGNALAMKELDGCELWFDKIFGEVQFKVEYRVDQNPCWIEWLAWKECTAKDCQQDTATTYCPDYPSQPYCESYRIPLTLPKPPVKCVTAAGRPSNLGFQFQLRVSVKGWARCRGVFLYALPRARKTYESIVC